MALGVAETACAAWLVPTRPQRVAKKYPRSDPPTALPPQHHPLLLPRLPSLFLILCQAIYADIFRGSRSQGPAHFFAVCRAAHSAREEEIASPQLDYTCKILRLAEMKSAVKSRTAGRQAPRRPADARGKAWSTLRAGGLQILQAVALSKL